MKIPQICFVKSVAGSRDKPDDVFPEIAMVGRSNVGKSSLINSLFNRKNLAKISSTPGKTRLINYFNVEDKFYLVDLPGYGYAKLSRQVTKNWEKLVSTYLVNNKSLKWVFLLIDSRHDLMDLDRRMINWLTEFSIPFIIVYTKSDKISRNLLNKRLNNLTQELAVVKIIPYSAKTHAGRDIVLQLFEEFN